MNRIYSIVFVFPLGILLLLCASCLAPQTHRTAGTRVPPITKTQLFGPFYERTEFSDETAPQGIASQGTASQGTASQGTASQGTASQGTTRVSIRPFLYTSIDIPQENFRIREFLWPLFAEHSRDDSASWRFLFWFGHDFDTSDPDSRYFTYLFPFYFEKRPERGAPVESALFPIHGAIPKFLLFDRIEFTLFPIWMKTEHQGTTGRHILFPLISWDRGKVEGWRLFPFYGHLTKEGDWERHFILWPLWSSATYIKDDAKQGYQWCLIPFYGKAEHPYEYSRYYLPPFFRFTYGRGRNEGERNHFILWPLIRIQDNAFGHKRAFYPFYATSWTDNSRNTHAFWPLWHYATYDTPREMRTEWSLAPIYYRSRVWQGIASQGMASQGTASQGITSQGTASKELTLSYTRVWPLASHVDTEGVSTLRIPDFSLTRSGNALDRNILGVFTLYTYKTDTDENRTENSLLWGFLRWGNDENGWHLSRLFWIPLRYRALP